MKRILSAVLALVMAVSFCVGLSGCGEEKREIVFADVGWDLSLIHISVMNAVTESCDKMIEVGKKA